MQKLKLKINNNKQKGTVKCIKTSRFQTLINLKPFDQQGEILQKVDIGYAVRKLIKYYNGIKQQKKSQKKEMRFHKVYTNLIEIIDCLFSEFFDVEISRQLSLMLNKLVYFYENQDYSQSHTHTNYEDCGNSNQQNYVKKINETERSNQSLQKVVKQENTWNLIEQYKESQPQRCSLKHKSAKIQSLLSPTLPKIKQHFHIFIYEKLRNDYAIFKKQKQIINEEIQQTNKRILQAEQKIINKIRQFQMQQIVSGNQQKSNIKFDKENIKPQ